MGNPCSCLSVTKFKGEIMVIKMASTIKAAGNGQRPSPDLTTLDTIQKRVLWLATNMIHHANHVRPNPDGGKVGGHQASSASVVTLMTAITFAYLRAGDRVAVKPHASPVLHAINYLLGQLPRDYLPRLRAYGGLQSYPSRTKDPDPIDFSTGSVGLGAVAPLFTALAAEYAQNHFGPLDENAPPRRFIALVGDAELDEGNVWEALLEEPLRRLGSVLWIVDLNRQSLDRVVPGEQAARLRRLFAACGWRVLEAKYGQRLQALFAQPGGAHLQARLEALPNEAYQALIRLPGTAIRRKLTEPDGAPEQVTADLLADIPDAALPGLLQNLGGHDFGELLARLGEADAERERPSVLLAHTIKGWGLPLAGHPLNHSMLLAPAQVDELRAALEVGADEWAAFPADSPAGRLCAATAARLHPGDKPRPRLLSPDDVPTAVEVPTTGEISTQQTFGRLLLALSRAEPLARRLVTAAPDVAVSTNLSGWIAKAGVYAREPRPNYEKEVDPTNAWNEGPHGQHIELGISEMNLFMLLGAFGLSAELIGEHLIPIGTVYDPFVCRGLDAFIYGLYSGAKFIIAGTPSGVTLAPEGGAHQSTVTSSLGAELPNLNFFEPCYAQELAWILLAALRDCCDRENGRATYLRLSTRAVEQRPFQAALARLGEARLRAQVLAGGYRLHDWRSVDAALDKAYLVHIAATGAMLPEALAAAEQLQAEGIPANVLNLTSPRRLFESWCNANWGRRSSAECGMRIAEWEGRSAEWGVRSAERGVRSAEWGFEWLIPVTERHAPIITVNDGASHALAWLGSVFGTLVAPLGVDQFGQSGARDDLYRHFGIDADGIVHAALTALNRGGLA